jgi:poly(3-hydroxybutyrate) depolymerase
MFPMKDDAAGYICVALCAMPRVRGRGGDKDRTMVRTRVANLFCNVGDLRSPVETYNQGSTVCRTYQTCKDGVEVAFCAITSMGHCWPEDTNCGPQQGAGVTDFKMNPMMWSYFNRHPLP